MSSTRCLGRLVDDKITGYFGNGKNKFHLELRCDKVITDASGLCVKCQARPRELQKNHPPLLHGVVNGPIPPWSHIFGSAWYESKVAAFGIPSGTEMAKAKKAQEEARKGSENQSAPVEPMETKPTVEVATVPVKAPAAPKKRGAKKVDAAPVEATRPAASPPQTTPKPKKKRVTKINIVESEEEAKPTPAVKGPVPTAAIESTESVLEGIEVMRISVKKMEHDGTEYFLDSNKGKLYSIGSDKRPSAYVGRWDPRNELIDREFPDSDAE